jgi:hypothetical protein
VLDHVIVAERGFFSMSEDGELPSQGSSAPSRRPAGLAGSAKD